MRINTLLRSRICLVLCVSFGIIGGYLIRPFYDKITSDVIQPDSTTVYLTTISDVPVFDSQTENEILMFLICTSAPTNKMALQSKIDFFTAIKEVKNWSTVTDIYLMLALAKAESEFDVFAVSTQHAKGLYQITPIAIRHYTQKYKPAWYNGDIYDIYTNAFLSATIIIDLYNKYQSIDAALSAYNGREPYPSSFSQNVLLLREDYIYMAHTFFNQNIINPLEIANG